MKFTVHLTATQLIAIIGMLIAGLLVMDISARRSTPTFASASAVGSSEKVVAKEFCLIDDAGQTRARIGMNEYNAPSVQLFDKNGQRRAQLRLNGDEVPSLRLYDNNGQVRSVTGFNLGTMEPGLAMFNGNGEGHFVNAFPEWVSSNQTVHDEDTHSGQRIHVFQDNNNARTIEQSFTFTVPHIQVQVQAEEALAEAEKTRQDAEDQFKRAEDTTNRIIIENR